jgi:hypothetical protein
MLYIDKVENDKYFVEDDETGIIECLDYDTLLEMRYYGIHIAGVSENDSCDLVIKSFRNQFKNLTKLKLISNFDVELIGDTLCWLSSKSAFEHSIELRLSSICNSIGDYSVNGFCVKDPSVTIKLILDDNVEFTHLAFRDLKVVCDNDINLNCSSVKIDVSEITNSELSDI